MTLTRAIVFATPWIAAAVIAVLVGPLTGAVVAGFALLQNTALSDNDQ
jgi:acetyl-CoA carboxylase beta subunit